MEQKIRLDKLIASQGVLTRSDVKRLIKQKQILVNGIAAKDSGDKVNPETDEIIVSGQALNFKEHIYLMMNKPKGVVSATEDDTYKTVISYVPEMYKRPGLFPAGRLDADTTGFVLITDDGEFAHDILSPKKHIEKTYLATLAEPLSKEDIERLESGITLRDGTECLSSKVKVVDPDTNTVEIKIMEGKYHQVKRMFAACNNKVVELKRIAMGNLKLDESLEPGQVKELKNDQIGLIKGNKN